MLRIQSSRLGQQLQPVWRQSLFAIRHESTSSSEPVKKSTEKPSLSQRLGGSGRGKVMESNGQQSDAFASFLVQAQKKQQQRSRNNNNKRQGGQQREAKPGQFDDAPTDKPTGEKRSDNKQRRQQASGKNNNNNNKRQGSGQQRQASGQQRQGAGQQRDRKPRQDTRKSYGATSTSGPTRRATTFIDKDIDWASLSPVESAVPEGDEGTTINKEQLEKELNSGDYTRFLSMGESIQWPSTLNRQGLESLMGSNASYGLDEKMTFLATVAKASSVGGAATAKK